MTVTSSRTLQYIVLILVLTAIAGGVYHYLNVRAAKLTAPADTVVFITTPGASSWTVPVGVTSVKVEAIGGGGGGGGYYGSGGGGGAYATASNISVTPGSSISVSVGTAGTAGSPGSDNATAGGDTTFNTNTVIVKGGAKGVNASQTTTAGGSAAGSTPSSGAYSGGGGGAGNSGWGNGGGGGGSASKLGAGGSGGSATSTSRQAAGGGGSGGGTNGTGAGAGGNNDAGTGGGTIGCSNGSSSANHSAGGGGGGNNYDILGCNGGSGQEWDSTHGSGGGGGGGAGTFGGGESAGGTAGNYGGGGGGGGYNRAGGAGAPGLIIITYKATTATMNTSPTTLNTNGLVGYWTFDGKDTVWTSSTAATTLDTSGQSNTGTLTNMNRATSPIEGKLGQGLKFDGVDDRIQISSWTTESTLYTVSLWFNKVNGVSGAGSMLARADSSTCFYNPRIDMSGTTLTVAESGCSGTGIIGTKTVTSGWHHVVVTRSGSSEKFYYDGVLSATVSGVNNSGTGKFAIGSSYGQFNGGYQSFYNGQVDEVRTYNRALSAGEVMQLYKLGAAKSR